MGISGRGDGTAGPALHADVLAGLNDEQRAAASYGGGAGTLQGARRIAPAGSRYGRPLSGSTQTA
jgi:hypothetical protein